MRGIARTMKLETYLNAIILADKRLALCRFGFDNKWRKYWDVRKLERQAHAFRARILRMDAEKDVQISQMMELVRTVDNLRKNRLNSDYIFAMDLAKMLIQRDA